MLSRRQTLKAFAGAGGALVAQRFAAAQVPSPPGPPSTVTIPPRDFGPGAPPVTYADPDIVTVDPRFRSYILGNTPLMRLWTGGLWCEGPAWSAQGRYL